MTEIIQEQQTEQLEQLQEVQISDGQTDNMPPPPELEQMEQMNPMTATPSESVACEFYTKDEFFEVFKSVFDYAGNLTGTESLPIKQNEMTGARLTSDRLYETAEKYAFMRPIIRRNTTRVMETILILQFISGKACAVYKEKTNLNLGGILWKKAKKVLGFKKQTAVAVSDSLAQADAEKQQKAENLSKAQTG